MTLFELEVITRLTFYNSGLTGSRCMTDMQDRPWNNIATKRMKQNPDTYLGRFLQVLYLLHVPACFVELARLQQQVNPTFRRLWAACAFLS